MFKFIPLLFALNSGNVYQTSVCPKSHDLKKSQLNSLLNHDDIDSYGLNNLYDEYGCTNDDALVRWANNDIDFLKKNSIRVSSYKLYDEHENILYTITIEYNNDEYEDRILHVYEERGATSRFYAPIGRNSNGISKKDFTEALAQVKKDAGAVGLLQLGIIAFIASGEFRHLYHDITFIYRDKEMNDLLTATGIVTFFTSKFAQWLITDGLKKLNPKYQWNTVKYLSPPKKRVLSRQIDSGELVSELLMDRLDSFYNGALKHGALNPELKISLRGIRQKSDQNWTRELKMAVKEITAKRAELLGVSKVDQLKESSNPKLNSKEVHVNICQNFDINYVKDKTEFLSEDEKSSIKNEVLNLLKNDDELFAQFFSSLEQEFLDLNIDYDRELLSKALKKSFSKSHKND